MQNFSKNVVCVFAMKSILGTDVTAKLEGI